LHALFGEIHHCAGTARDPHCAIHSGIGGFVRFDLELSLRNPRPLGLLQLGELLRRHLLFEFAVNCTAIPMKSGDTARSTISELIA
jgi:hypothetical protein